jgi:ribosome-interacting GTPase 1
MPANLPPQYYAAEEDYRKARTPEDKIAAVEEMLAIMPKHKGTDHLRAELRARIAKLSETSGKRATLHRASNVIPKEGAGQVAVVGLANSGKSQLVARVTNASPAVADYPFTTLTATPGMMEFENVHIQLIDMPALAPQLAESWIASLLKRADALLVLVDLSVDPTGNLESVLTELARMRIGITGLSQNREPAVLYWKKAVIAGNKSDLPGAFERYAFLQRKCQGDTPVVAISALKGTGLEDMKRLLFESLEVIRVFTKAPGQKADLNEPLVVPREATVEDAAMALHRNFAAKLKYARIWGTGRHEGMTVGRTAVLQDGDIIELHF